MVRVIISVYLGKSALYIHIGIDIIIVTFEFEIKGVPYGYFNNISSAEMKVQIKITFMFTCYLWQT